MIPVQVVLVPFYRTMLALDLVNTRIGLILSYTAFFLPFSVYLMTAFYSRPAARAGRGGADRRRLDLPGLAATSCCRWASRR